MSRTLCYFTSFCLVFILLSSCFSTKKATYFNNLNEGSFNTVEEIEYTIQKNDILSIYISSLNEEASKIFNSANNFVISSSTASGGSAQSSGYLVNQDGNIQLPILGNIKAAGLTKKEIKDNITKILLDKKLLIDPIVNIRHLNYEVTIIGEVGKPTVITVPNEKITMLKALGLAGDITIQGKKNNVLLIREKEGKKNVVRIDLNSSNFLTSPYYYLQPNDVVYVETNKNKIANNSRALLIIPSLLGSLAILAATIIQVVR